MFLRVYRGHLACLFRRRATLPTIGDPAILSRLRTRPVGNIDLAVAPGRAPQTKKEKHATQRTDRTEKRV